MQHVESIDLSPFRRTRRLMLRRSFTGGLTLQEWAGTIQAADWVLRKSGTDDGAIAAARRWTVNIEPDSSDIIAAMLAEAKDANSREGTRQLHDLISIATHLARQDPALTSHQRLLIANLSRDLDGLPRPSRDLTEALSNWGHTIFEIAPHLDAHQWRSVARWQSVLMNTALRARSSIAAPEQPPLDRLWPAVEAERDTWAIITSRLGRWTREPPGLSQVNSPAARALSLAANQLSAAVKDESSPAQLLDACIRTDFANNLILAHQLDQDRPGPQSTATRLHEICALVHPPMIQELPPTLHIEHPPADPAQIQAPRHERAKSLSPQPPALAPDPLTREQAASYARQRDAGIIAQAALDGKAEAKRVTELATPTELASIAKDGRLAVATLAASAYPWAQKLYFRLAPRNFAVDEAGPGLMNEALMHAAHTFDPSRSSLTTWVHKTISWHAAGAARANFSRTHAHTAPADPASFDRHQSDAPTTAELAVNRVEAAKVRSAIDRLEPSEAHLVKTYFGIDGWPPKTDREIAESYGVSVSTINRKRNQALHRLQEALTLRNGPEIDVVAPKNTAPPARPSAPLIDTCRERSRPRAPESGMVAHERDTRDDLGR